MLYHRTAVEALDSYIYELIDYCYRKITFLIQKYYLMEALTNFNKNFFNLK